MFKGMDFGFVGQSYQAAMVLQDAEDTINWFIERAPQDVKAKMPNALLGCPGLNALIGTQAGPVRGAWVLPGSTQALVAVSDSVWLITLLVPATSTSIAQFGSTYVGALLTTSGPVVMRDNGVLQNGEGGYCFIVDGTYCYYYLLSGVPYANVFTAATQSSTVLAFPGSLPNGLIVTSAGTLSATSGFIPGGALVDSVDTIGLTLTMNNAATGSMVGDVITLTIPAFGQITDAGFLGADRIAFIEGWLIFNEPNTRTFFTTGPTPYSMLFPGLSFSLKDSSTDNLVTLYEQNRELWLIGERTAEVWFNAGLSPGVAFERIPGVGPQIGCSAKHSITRLGERLIWLGRNEQGQNVIVGSKQYTWERLSTHAVEHAIASYPVINDAIGYGYEEEGHAFYMLTFPTADITWCLDASTGSWHKRLSFDPVAGIYHRHRGNCFMDFGDVRIVGDYQSGYLLQMSRAFYADNYAISEEAPMTNPLRALRRTPHVWSAENRERVFMAQLQVEFTPGVGLQTGQGSAPQAMLSYSNDGGFTWPYTQWTTIGAAGETKNRAIWRLLGRARDRVWQVVITDPVPRDIIGATLYAEAS